MEGREDEKSKPFVAGDRKMVAHDARIHRLLRGDETEAAPVARPSDAMSFELKCLEVARRAIAAGWTLDGFSMLGSGQRISLLKAGQPKVSKLLKPEDFEGKDIDQVVADLIGKAE